MTRAATLGYSVGDKKFGAEGEEQNVCNQIAPDCSDGPNLQRKGVYEYDIGQVPIFIHSLHDLIYECQMPKRNERNKSREQN